MNGKKLKAIATLLSFQNCCLASCAAVKAKNILVFQRTMQRKDGATHAKKMECPTRAVLRDTRAPQMLWSSMCQHAQMSDMILHQFVAMLASCQPILRQLLPSFDCCQLFLTLLQQNAGAMMAIHSCDFLHRLPSSDQLPSQPTMSFLFSSLALTSFSFSLFNAPSGSVEKTERDRERSSSVGAAFLTGSESPSACHCAVACTTKQHVCSAQTLLHLIQLIHHIDIVTGIDPASRCAS